MEVTPMERVFWHHIEGNVTISAKTVHYKKNTCLYMLRIIYPKAKILQDMTFPFYEDWVVLFGTDRATGEGAEGPAEAVDREEALGEGDDINFTINIDDMDFSGNSGSEGGATSTPTSKGGKKRARASDLTSMANSFATLVEKAHTSMNELSKRIGYAQYISQAMKNVFAELMKLPLQSNDRLRAANEIVKNDKRVDLFFSLPDDHKMEFVCMVLIDILPP
ncbi:uncharacterized protein LOC130751521 [Actinidia eriantha]|uniref:uncharacterized protein LOC130751521 n=1 Tax=Actinidia eriantha TaxID=165200 RepID=UPI00258767B4|nr:uncharacterized protein LOC130751521 [Actinidia eriantha]